MKFLAAATKFAFVGTQMTSRNLSNSQGAAVLRSTLLPGRSMVSSSLAPRASQSTRLFASTRDDVQLRNVGKPEMEEIVEDYEEGGREESGYVVLDVREPNEVVFTGSLSPNTINLPLQLLAQQNVFSLDEDDFEEVCGFAKPTPDETLVFSCAAGIRSVQAAQFAAMNGYTKLVNYKGGANEWFM